MVRFTARGHPAIAGTHDKTLEFTRDLEITRRATCVLGVAADYDDAELLALRGRVGVTLECGGHRDTFEATVSPFFLGDSSLVLRRGPDLRQRTFAFGASKTAAEIDRGLVEALADPNAVLTVTVQPEGGSVEPGALFVVALPIGNDDDLSPRALRVLQHVDVVLAEDTRRVHALARRAETRTATTISYHDRNERARVDDVIARLQRGERVALVSDAGTPLLSDPGYVVVERAVAEGLPVSPVPGPVAAIAVASVSGLPVHELLFAGFLPRTSAKRRAELQRLAAGGATVACYEAPTRIAAFLRDLDAVGPDWRVCVGREVTKVFEEFLYGTAADVADALGESPVGEFTVLFAPGGIEVNDADAGATDGLVRALIAEGVPAKTISKALAREPGTSRNAAYERVLRLGGS